MRKQDKIIIWPAYFDSTKTRRNGRRVPKNWATLLPKISEIKVAAEKLSLSHELVENAGYPGTPWHKTGMLAVNKKEAKERTIRKIASQLLKIRNASPATK